MIINNIYIILYINTGIGGSDIVDGSEKLILALLEQMMRYHIISFLDKLQRKAQVAQLTSAQNAQSPQDISQESSREPSDLDHVNNESKVIVDASLDVESMLLHWSNHTLISSNTKNGYKTSNPRQLSSFTQKSISSSLVLLDLLWALRPHSFSWSLVHNERPNEAEKFQNAKLAVTLAQKYGCVVFTRPEHIVNGRSKMILLFVAALMTRTFT